MKSQAVKPFTPFRALPAFAKIAFLGCFLLSVFQPFSLSALSQRASADDPLATLRKEHPRLIVTPQEWADFDTRARNRAADPLFDSLLTELEQYARDLLAKEPVERKLREHRLLSVSQEVVQRVLTLAVVHRATGDDVFLRRAEKEMLAVAGFENWNPGHFIDTAEMTAALAIGYDWLYHKLSPESRTTIRRAIATKGLVEHKTSKARKPWHQRENNWNSICSAGLSFGALAIAEDNPKAARDILELVRDSNMNGLKPYAPDGVYPEGPAYWTYGTSYQALLIAALESALGTDWDLGASPGFLASAGAQFQLRGPSGGMFSFSDGLKNNAYFSPIMFWFAKKTGNPAFAIPPAAKAGERAEWFASNIHAPRIVPLIALWWPKDGLSKTPPAPAIPLAWMGRGNTPVAAFRSSWTDPDALWLACKAGVASTSHAHMDAGSFVLEADGVRWADDLGGQPYDTLEAKGMKPFDSKQSGQRWTVFRYNNFSHNTLTINNQLHRVDGRADFVKFWDANDAKAEDAMRDGEMTSGAVMDLSAVFAGQAKKAHRVFTFFPKSRRVWIADTIEGAKPGAEIRWAMVTKAQVRISEDGAHAELTQDGKTLTATIMTSPGEETPSFEVIPAAPAVENNYDAANPDERILIARAKAPQTGAARILVELRSPAKN